MLTYVLFAHAPKNNVHFTVLLDLFLITNVGELLTVLSSPPQVLSCN